MKKLMILAAVAVVATCSQAASFKWSTTGVKDVTGENAYSGSATLYAIINGTDTVVDTQAMSGGVINAANTTFSNDKLVAGTTYSFYYTMADDAGNTFKSATRSAKAQQTATVPISFGNGGEWTPAPEPPFWTCCCSCVMRSA